MSERLCLLKRRATRFKKINRKRSLAEEYFRQELMRQGIKYQRQKVVSNLIVDFYFRKRGLIVEIDGPEHSLERDMKRDLFLKSKGYDILRFKNEDVLKDSSSCVSQITEFKETPQKGKVFAKILGEINSLV